MKIGCIIQARQGSTRLPGKALLDLCGQTVIQRLVERVRQAQLVNEIVVAMTTNPKDDDLFEECVRIGVKCYRGSEEDVLTRVLECAKAFEIDIIIEITGDEPLIDYNHIDGMIRESQNVSNCIDFISNVEPRTFPRGYDLRMFKTLTLEQVDKEVDNSLDRQHCSSWMFLNPKGRDNYIRHNIYASPDDQGVEYDVTLDTIEDYRLIEWLFKAGQEYNLDLTCSQVIGLLKTYPDKYVEVAEIGRKDYLQELAECYEREAKKVEPVEEVESVDSRDGKTGRFKRPTKKPKRR